jgi:hypothetical protein
MSLKKTLTDLTATLAGEGFHDATEAARLLARAEARALVPKMTVCPLNLFIEWMDRTPEAVAALEAAGVSWNRADPLPLPRPGPVTTPGVSAFGAIPDGPISHPGAATVRAKGDGGEWVA